MKKRRSGFGLKDGNSRGIKAGGRGRNKTTTCRHPSKKSREKQL
jgi:hypothetical protein